MFFYWNFLPRHRDRLSSLGRMNLVLANLKGMSATENNKGLARK
jgi:deoxyribodipyrimidine photolyase-related protein